MEVALHFYDMRLCFKLYYMLIVQKNTVLFIVLLYSLIIMIHFKYHSQSIKEIKVLFCDFNEEFNESCFFLCLSTTRQWSMSSTYHQPRNTYTRSYTHVRVSPLHSAQSNFNHFNLLKTFSIYLKSSWNRFDIHFCSPMFPIKIVKLTFGICTTEIEGRRKIARYLTKNI